MSHLTRCVFFVLLVLILPPFLSAFTTAQPNTDSQDLTISQDNGLVFNETMYFNGSSNYPLAHSKWFLVNLANGWGDVLDSGPLSNVTAVAEGEWHWSIELDVTMYNCTCGFLISHETLNHPPVIQRIVYLGSTNHQPYILPFRLVEHDLNTPLYMLTNEDLVMKVPLIIPSHIENDSFIQLKICSAANLFCLDDMIDFDDYDSLQVGRELSLIFERENLNLSDGYWMFSIVVIDSLLRTSNKEYFTLLIDQNSPKVTLTCDVDEISISDSATALILSQISIEEDSAISFSASVSDGYSGRDNVLTWNLILPDDSRRALLSHEKISDTLISLQPDLPGIWTVDLSVRDSAGWLTRSTLEFEVYNIAPVLQLELDSFVVTEGSVVTLIDGDTWELNSSKSSDTSNDDQDLLYTWYLDGEPFVTGTTTVQSSDFPEPGRYNLRLIVEDNDGASNEISFEVLISEAVTPKSSNPLAVFLSLSMFILLIIGLGFVIRSSRRYANQTTVPKWITRDSSDSFQEINETEL